MDKELIFKAKRLDNKGWVEGFFTKKKIGELIVPVIEIYKEWDSGDYMESVEIDGNTLQKAYAKEVNQEQPTKAYMLECGTEDGTNECNGYYFNKSSAEKVKSEMDKYRMNMKYGIVQHVIEIEIEQ